MKNKKLIGRIDKLDLPELGLEKVQAKIDTGAYTSAIHCSNIHIEKADDSTELLTYTISGNRLGKGMKAKKLRTSEFKIKRIKSSNGQVQERYVIKTKIKIFNKIYNTEFSLSDRSHMKNPILLGRKLLSGKFVVDVTEENLSYQYHQKQSEQKSPLIPKKGKSK